MNDPLQGVDVQRQLSEILNVSAAALSSQDSLRSRARALWCGELPVGFCPRPRRWLRGPVGC